MGYAVTLDLVNVHCGNTEDVGFFGVGSEDEFYLTGGVAADGGARQAILTTPISIDDGDTKSFGGQARLWSGTLETGQSLALFLDAYDEDAAKDWSHRPSWIDSAASKLGGALGGEAAGGVTALLASNPAGWAVLGGAVAAGLVIGGFYFFLGNDKDDRLGTLNVVIPADGPADEVRSWHFANTSSFLGYSTWDYTVTYRIHRDLPKDSKDSKDGADSKASTDTKTHKDSKDHKDVKDRKEVETKTIISDKVRDKLIKERDTKLLRETPVRLSREALDPADPAGDLARSGVGGLSGPAMATFINPSERPDVGPQEAQATLDEVQALAAGAAQTAREGSGTES